MSSLWQNKQTHNGSLWRTCAACSVQTRVKRSGKSLMRWPTAGSMCGGHVYGLTSQWEPAIGGIVGLESPTLPTPRAQNGESRNMTPWVRPLGEPQNLDNAIARLPGVVLNPVSDDGKLSWVEHPPPR